MTERNEISMVFEDPPAGVLAHAPRISHWKSHVEQLVASPGKWAKFGPFSTKTSLSGIRSNLAKHAPGVKFNMAKHDDGEIRWIYVRTATTVEAPSTASTGKPKERPVPTPKPTQEIRALAPVPSPDERRLGVGEHGCTICDEVFDTRGALARHRRAQDHYDDEVAG